MLLHAFCFCLSQDGPQWFRVRPRSIKRAVTQTLDSLDPDMVNQELKLI